MKRSFPPKNSKLQGTEAPTSHHPASKDSEVTTGEIEVHTHRAARCSHTQPSPGLMPAHLLSHPGTSPGSFCRCIWRDLKCSPSSSSPYPVDEKQRQSEFKTKPARSHRISYFVTYITALLYFFPPPTILLITLLKKSPAEQSQARRCGRRAQEHSRRAGPPTPRPRTTQQNHSTHPELS